MRFSVIIPTHDPKHLREAVDSVLAQTNKDFEILVVPNGPAQLGDLLPDDSRIRVSRYPGTGNVGAIKAFGFQRARGEILVELDHDDLLMPDALESIGAAMADGADFVYSNSAEFHDVTWEPNVYDVCWGWQSRPVHAFGHDLIEMISFPPTAVSMSRVWWAPNHVRAWTKETYARVGGHNISMDVCDDHDLVIRTYLTSKCVLIDKCLYLYRVSPEQTSQVKNTRIQELTHQLYGKNIDALVRREMGLRGLPCFDLGGGHNNAEGWRAVDIQGTGVTADLTQRWPWEDSSVGAFRAYDFLEHLPDKQHTMAELHRCLVPGGWLLSFTPSAVGPEMKVMLENGNVTRMRSAGQGAYQDPTHVSFWVENSFKYYTDIELAKYIRNTSVRFQPQRLVTDYPNAWYEEQGLPYITFDAVALKGEYDGPGEIKI